MTLNIRRSSLAAALILLSGVAGAQSDSVAPRSLYGNSIVLTWQDSRVTEKLVAGNPRYTSNLSHASEFYVGFQGHVFTRYIVTDNKKFNKQFDRLGADPKRTSDASNSATSTFQEIRFEGHVLVALQKAGASHIRHTEVVFGSDFESCVAKIAHAFEARKAKDNVYLDWDGVQKRTVEIHEIAPECVVKKGNVFE